MASFTLTTGSMFPDGTSVGAYPQGAFSHGSGGAPGAAALEFQSMNLGQCTFSTLVAGTVYWAAAEVGGEWRRVLFITNPVVLGAGLSATIVDAKGDVLAATADDSIDRLPVGADGEVLTADSTRAQGIKWSSAPGGGIPDTILDTKGDLIAASAADTAAILPAGTDGQFLIADSGETTGLGWATHDPIDETLANAKGDLLVASGADTVTRLAIGTNDQVLVADSAQATGIKWAALPGGAFIPVSLVDAKGDIIAGTAADTVARKAVGANGTALFANSALTTGLEWRAIAQTDVANLSTDLAAKQQLDTDLTAIAALTSAADKMPRATGAGTWTMDTVTAYARTLLDDTTATAARTTLNAQEQLPEVTPEQFGAVGDDSTNDTAAFQAAINSLTATGGTIRLGPKTYRIDGTPQTGAGAANGNSVLYIPITQVNRITFKGDPFKRSIIKSTITTTAGAYSATNGPPSLVGSATWEKRSGEPTPMLDFMVVWDGIDIQVQHDATGGAQGPWLSGLDFNMIVRAIVRDSFIYTNSQGSEKTAGVRSHTFGLRLPQGLNFGRVRADHVDCYGFQTAFVFHGAHTELVGTTAKWNLLGYGLIDRGGTDPHLCHFFDVKAEHNNRVLAGVDELGAKSLTTIPCYCVGTIDIEDAAAGSWNSPHATEAHVMDANDQIRGQLNYHRVTEGVGLSTGPLTVLGAIRLTLREIRAGLLLQHPSSQAVSISGGAIVLPGGLPSPGMIRLGGATNVTAGISTNGSPHQILVIKFSSALTVTDGGNLNMAGNFVAAGGTGDHDTLTLMSDGTEWWELARSTN